MMTHSTFDKECKLVEKFKTERCEEAFAQLYLLFFESIFDYLNRIVKDLELSSDLTQDTFITVFQKLHTLRENRTFRLWIFRIAKNKAMKHFRMKNIQKNVLDNISIDQFECENQMEKVLEKEEMYLKMEKVLFGVNENEKNLIIEKYYHQKSIKELSTASGLSHSALKMKIHRTRIKIKDRMVADLG